MLISIMERIEIFQKCNFAYRKTCAISYKIIKKEIQMSKSLNELVVKYLKENGMTSAFFCRYIGENKTTVSLWLHGKGNIGKEILPKIHEFLSGKHLRTLEDIIKEMEGE